MRDSRLYRMMTTTGDVTWRRPADAPGAPAAFEHDPAKVAQKLRDERLRDEKLRDSR